MAGGAAVLSASTAVGTANTFFARFFCLDDVRHSAADDEKNDGEGDDGFGSHIVSRLSRGESILSFEFRR